MTQQKYYYDRSFPSWDSNFFIWWNLGTDPEHMELSKIFFLLSKVEREVGV